MKNVFLGIILQIIALTVKAQDYYVPARFSMGIANNFTYYSEWKELNNRYGTLSIRGDYTIYDKLQVGVQYERYYVGGTSKTELHIGGIMERQYVFFDIRGGYVIHPIPLHKNKINLVSNIGLTFCKGYEVVIVSINKFPYWTESIVERKKLNKLGVNLSLLLKYSVSKHFWLGLSSNFRYIKKNTAPINAGVNLGVDF